MTGGKIAALVLVYALAATAWATLGGSIIHRQNSTDGQLRPKVEALWGTPLTQVAPSFVAQDVPDKRRKTDTTSTRAAVQPVSNAIAVDFRMNFRRKGLLWYRTYDVTFDGLYTIRNGRDKPIVLTADLALPAARQTYDDFVFQAEGGEPGQMAGEQGRWACSKTIRPGEEAKVRLKYTTRGMDRWSYQLGQAATYVRNFSLKMTTDFGGFDFPSTSPTTPATPTSAGYEFEWRYASLLSGLEISLDMPTRLNPGPLASRISFFAPVGLAFFMVVMVLIGVVRDRNLHPMHYLFVCSAFFGFHLLFSYLVDQIDINQAFVISAAVSVFLVATYVMRFMGPRFAFLVVAPAQVIYLVLFSYAFFFQGQTGLTITIAAVLTLFALMQLTAKIDWDEKLKPRTPMRPERPGVSGPPALPTLPPGQAPTS